MHMWDDLTALDILLVDRGGVEEIPIGFEERCKLDRRERDTRPQGTHTNMSALYLGRQSHISRLNVDKGHRRTVLYVLLS